MDVSRVASRVPDLRAALGGIPSCFVQVDRHTGDDPPCARHFALAAPMTHLKPPGPPPSTEQVLRHLRRSNDVARRAMSLGHHPFGAVLVAPDHETVLLEQCNIDTVNHAESTLARIAASNFTADYLWQCTLYTAVEPCCMCAGTAYWANIGRVVYGMTEADLLQQTGDHAENPTMHLPSRQVFAHGQKAVDVIGPVPEIAAETVALQQDFWARR